MSSVFDEFGVDKCTLHINEKTVYKKINPKARWAPLLISLFVNKNSSVDGVVVPR